MARTATLYRKTPLMIAMEINVDAPVAESSPAKPFTLCALHFILLMYKGHAWSSLY